MNKENLKHLKNLEKDNIFLSFSFQYCGVSKQHCVELNFKDKKFSQFFCIRIYQDETIRQFNGVFSKNLSNLKDKFLQSQIVNYYFTEFPKKFKIFNIFEDYHQMLEILSWLNKSFLRKQIPIDNESNS